ncbi:Membrane-bound lytic murein transglycosylase F [subsurface metagenome]
MALLGLLSFFGKAYSAIPFLLDSMHIPSDIFNLYKIAAVVTGRFSTLLAAMHLLALSLVAASAISGLLEIKFKKILTFAVTTFALLGILMTGARILQSRVLKYEYTKDKVIAGMQLLFDPVEATVHKTAPPGPPILRPGQSVMDRIQESGILRVGYDANKMPASYFNANEDLVGFDIDMAHQLAREIGVSLEFIPFEYQTMTEHLREGQFDIIMSAIPITTSLLKDMTFSDPYLDLTFALAVKDYRRQEFASLEDIQRIRGLKIGIHWRYSYFHDKAKSAFPLAEVVGIDSIQDYFGGKRDDIDVLLISAEGGSAWTLLHPEYQIVIPKPTVIKQPIGYPVAGGDLEMINFLNRWIDLKKKDGTIERIYNYWILGMGASEKEPRWSILRNVLHWVD